MATLLKEGLRNNIIRPIDSISFKTKFSQRQKTRRFLLKLAKPPCPLNKLDLQMFSPVKITDFDNQLSQCLAQNQRTEIHQRNKLINLEACLSSVDFLQQNYEQFRYQRKLHQQQKCTRCSLSAKEAQTDHKKRINKRKQFMYQKLEEVQQRSLIALLTSSIKSSIKSDILFSEDENTDHSQLSKELQSSQQDYFETSSLNCMQFEQLHVQHHGEEKVCQICMDDIIENEDEILLNCCHGFHLECIEVWLKEHVTCPLCKMNVHKQSFEDLRLAHIKQCYDGRIN